MLLCVHGVFHPRDVLEKGPTSPVRFNLRLCQSTGPTQVAWVQYIDRVGKLDVVERALGCVKLKWSQTSIPLSELGPEEDSMFLDVLPVSTVRGRDHVVRGDYELSGTVSHKCSRERHWTQQWFYLNRFREPNRKKMFTVVMWSCW